LVAIILQRLGERVENSGWNLSQITGERGCSIVDAVSDAAVERNPGAARFDLETIFHAQYPRIARVIASVIRDPARAEEIAVDVFLKWSQNQSAQGELAAGWLYRVAVRMAHNELRRRTRRSRYESLFDFIRPTPTPEDLLAAQEEQEKIDVVLSVIEPRQAELLMLRSNGFTYDELACALQLNPASVGTLLVRAQQAFRREYSKRYERGR
jgi:RNA polymerase sigma-70 factor (ECF subfamily)